MPPSSHYQLKKTKKKGEEQYKETMVPKELQSKRDDHMQFVNLYGEKI